MEYSDWIKETLNELKDSGLHRSLTTYDHGNENGTIRYDGTNYVNFSSNDYQSLSYDPTVLQKSQQYLCTYGVGSGASRLVTGSSIYHEKLEKRLAAFKGYEAALLFGSGFLTNLGVISSLIGKDDFLFIDKLAHASMIDGAQLCRGKMIRFRHNDMNHLEELLSKYIVNDSKKLIVTESIFSMDGDGAPLQELTSLAKRFNALLMVDEAHALGVFGKSGRGRIYEEGLSNDVHIAMGTCSKGLGAYGGFVATSPLIKDFLINKARSFIYTTSLPPAVIGSILGSLDVLESDPNRGKNLLQNSTYFKKQLHDLGFDTGNSISQIIPVIIGEPSKAMALSEALRQEGIIVSAIRPPTVPQNSSRLRFSLNHSHTKEILNHCIEKIYKCASKEGIL